MFLLQLVVDGVLHDVLDDRGPPRHLVGLFGDALLPGDLVRFAAAVPSLHNYVYAEVSHVVDGVLLGGGDLGVLQQLLQVLVGHAVLGQDVEQDDAQLVQVLHVGVQQDGDDVLHGVLNLLTFCIDPHCQVLFHFAELVDVLLVLLHAALRQVDVCGVLGQLLLVLRHLFDHL